MVDAVAGGPHAFAGIGSTQISAELQAWHGRMMDGDGASEYRLNVRVPLTANVLMVLCSCVLLRSP